ncbi:thioredoxin family protein [Pollutimonas thiosulfatoxidans]|uniref:Thiol reductase thioredoxin n=1 Tax=Pollutimonas thiosulfatoxidans TaxID=2028345 RepID=A0A410G8P7_9BURK|nr:thioredoxin family protein [Pollutimonas thiosulfatoxidans]MBF6618463.1 thioredoxin family protein [Candidimonas sp.]QAA92673.1 thiol reductase thioredoxin [Pollutimonas thiosulfatoxidans]
MPMNAQYTEDEPARESIDQAEGPLVLEFGASWCGICQAAQPLINQAFTDFQEVAHIKVADGSGRPLGRSFRIKLWPTLIFLRDGKEVSRLVRPTQAGEISKALRQITETQ